VFRELIIWHPAAWKGKSFSLIHSEIIFCDGSFATALLRYAVSSAIYYPNPFSRTSSHVKDPFLARAVWETIGVKQNNVPTQAD
jgi:hypothetical protein